MKNYSLQIFGLALMGTMLFGYQNCTKVQATALQSGSSSKMTGADTTPSPTDVDTLPPVASGTLPPTSSGTLPAPPSDDPHTQLDPREIRCKDMTPGAVPAIVYDSKTLTGTAPVSLSMMDILFHRTIDAETVADISNFAGSLKVTAATVDTISNFAANLVEINAKSVGQVENFAAAQVEIVAHEIQSSQNFAGDYCASVQKVGTIENLASRLSLYGRSEGGQKATLDRLGNVAGFISIYDFEIAGTLSNAAVHAKLVNSHLGKLENAAGDIILVDSVIDEVAHFAGRIVLKGSSKVLKTDSSAVMVVSQ